MKNFPSLATASSAASEILSSIISKAEKTITTNQYAQRNQPTFIVQSQNHIINSNFTHILTQPAKSPNKDDREPVNIPIDTLMNVGRLGSHTDGLSVKSQSQRHSIKTNKYDNNKRQMEFKQNSKNQILEKFKVILTEQNEKEEIEYDRLRQQKIHEEMLKFAEKPRERPKAVCILSKGEKIVFDYEGNPSKRKETGIKHLNNSILCGQASKELLQNQSRKGYSQQSSGTDNSKITPNKRTERSQKRKESIQTEKQIVFDLSNKKQAILKSLQIKNPGIKIIVDGQTAKVNKEIMEKNSQNSRLTQKMKVIQMKKTDIHQNLRFKTEVLPQKQSESVIASTIRKVERGGSQSGASGSIYFSKLDKISVENCFLQKLVLPNEDDVEDKYVELPSHRKRRVKTHLQSQSLKESNDFEGMKIKQKLIKITKNGQKFPKIISQYKFVQQQIMKAVKKKCLA